MDSKYKQEFLTAFLLTYRDILDEVYDAGFKEGARHVTDYWSASSPSKRSEQRQKAILAVLAKRELNVKPAG